MQFKRVKRSVVRLIAALEKELAEIDAEIYACVRGSAAWRKEGLIASVPGVASITARSFIAELPELGAAHAGVPSDYFRDSNEKLVSYISWQPHRA